MLSNVRKTVRAAASALLFFVIPSILLSVQSCTEREVIENEIEVPTYPDLEGMKADTLFMKSAVLEFYGAYSETVDRWYLTLYTGDPAEYDLGTDTYTGHGQMVKLCLQTAISSGKEDGWDVLVQHYTAPESYSDLRIGQWETGYDDEFDHPYYGTLWASYGSYYLSLDSQEYAPYMFIDGDFTMARDSAGQFTVEGMLVDGTFTKRRFVYKGDFTQIADYEFPGAPDSSLEKDVTLTRAELPKLWIFDRGDQYRYENPPRFSNYRVYLTGDGVSVSMPSKTSKVGFEGEGPVMMLDLFVNPDSNGKIPAGVYNIVTREPGGGIDGSQIWPFKILEGFPHYYFSTLQGSWYFNLASTGYWTGDYGRVTGGTLNVSYEAGSDEPVIKAELIDCSNPAHKIIIDWK